MNKLYHPSIRDIRSKALHDAKGAADDLENIRDRAAATNPTNHAYIALATRGVAKVEKAPENKCPLFGVPYACKDVFETQELPTTAGSLALADYRPKKDAVAVARLKNAGAVLIGKANMHEFCYGITGRNPFYGTPTNPHDPTRLAGGSSSGSAVSVATGSAVFSLGSDTGGSVRVPAALCGLVGLKPTYGLVNSRGMIPFCWTLDHPGVIARTCLDAAAVLEVVAGWSDGHDSGSDRSLEQRLTNSAAGSLKGLKIGVPRRYFYDRLDDEIRTAVEETLLLCRSLGAKLVDVTTPDMTYVRPASLAIQLVEAVSWHGPQMAKNGHLYGDDVRTGLVQGQFILAEHYIQSLRLMEAKRREFASLLTSVDILVTPTTPVIAPKLSSKFVDIAGEEELVGNALTRYTCIFNLTGHPALTVPCGQHSSGLPMGLQIVGKHYDDAKVLSVGHALETAVVIARTTTAGGASLS